MTLLTNTKAEVTAKADEVKTKAKTLTGFRMEIEKQLDKRIGSDSPVTLPLHFATPFDISVSISIHITVPISFLLSIFSFQFTIHLYQILWITIFKHLPLEISVIAKGFVYHDRQPQFRHRPQ